MPNSEPADIDEENAPVRFSEAHIKTRERLKKKKVEPQDRFVEFLSLEGRMEWFDPDQCEGPTIQGYSQSAWPINTIDPDCPDPTIDPNAAGLWRTPGADWVRKRWVLETAQGAREITPEKASYLLGLNKYEVGDLGLVPARNDPDEGQQAARRDARSDPSTEGATAESDDLSRSDREMSMERPIWNSDKQELWHLGILIRAYDARIAPVQFSALDGFQKGEWVKSLTVSTGNSVAKDVARSLNDGLAKPKTLRFFSGGRHLLKYKLTGRNPNIATP